MGTLTWFFGLLSKHRTWGLLRPPQDVPAEMSIKGSEEAIENALQYRLDFFAPGEENIIICVCQMSVLSLIFKYSDVKYTFEKQYFLIDKLCWSSSGYLDLYEITRTPVQLLGVYSLRLAVGVSYFQTLPLSTSSLQRS